jgi:protein-S-isoprenylcysteine O-methyltransferase Ste14
LRPVLKRLNDLAVFDAARWPAREVVGRILGGLLAASFLARQILLLPNQVGFIREVRGAEKFFEIFSSLPRSLFPPAVHLDVYYYPFGYSHEQVTTIWVLKLLLWTLITGSFVGYLVAYLTRAKAQSVAAGFMQTAFPVMVAVLPFVTLNSPFTYRDWFPESSESHITGLYGILGMLIAGGALQLMSLLALRRSFTIMSEARVLIRSGIYRWIRHPVYCSHFLINLCYTLVHFHAYTVALYLVFVAGQTVRARIEERKLTAAFPEYEEYRRTTGMFFPRLSGRGTEKT